MQNNQFGEQPLLGYARPFRTLNGKLVLIAPYGVERSSDSAVFNGILPRSCA